jgi:septum formation protein
MTPQSLVLGSTSPYRRDLLLRLGLDFVSDSPDIDESRLDNETPQQLVERLAIAKARAVAMRHPQALIIGSDQVACVDEQILGKPGNRANAISQLRQAAGKTVVFYTGLCLLNATEDRVQSIVEPFRVHFRQLTDVQIERYVDCEQPFNCAGSFKSEGLGISLFRRLEGDDPNALIGLPLIRLIDMLAAEGVELP